MQEPTLWAMLLLRMENGIAHRVGSYKNHALSGTIVRLSAQSARYLIDAIP